MYFLGGIYLEGRGVPQNESIALDYYQRAANANNPHGMTSLAYFHASKLRKEGKREDGLLAVKWSEQAFEYGCKICAMDLLNLYSYGPMHDEIQKVAWMLTYDSIKSLFESQQSKNFEPPYFWPGDETKKAGKLSQAKHLSILYSVKFASKKPANTVMNISSHSGEFYMR
ncbi:Sel1 repeat protein [compost metagenome]